MKKGLSTRSFRPSYGVSQKCNYSTLRVIGLLVPQIENWCSLSFLNASTDANLQNNDRAMRRIEIQ